MAYDATTAQNMRAQLIAGIPLATVASNFGVSQNSVIRQMYGLSAIEWLLPDHSVLGGGGTSTSGFELEDGSGVLLLEDGTILLLEVQ